MGLPPHEQLNVVDKIGREKQGSNAADDDGSNVGAGEEHHDKASANESQQDPREDASHHGEVVLCLWGRARGKSAIGRGEVLRSVPEGQGELHMQIANFGGIHGFRACLASIHQRAG